MKNEQEGYVIINENHPNNPKNKTIFTHTFSTLKKNCIENFIESSGKGWRYWYDKYNFRCVKATMTIQVKQELEAIN